MSEPFWKRKTLKEMTQKEWESLCDGCGRCCLQKVIKEETEELFYTFVSCRLLNTETCRCSSYENRQKLVPECIPLIGNLASFKWLPVTCAYRKLSEGKDLDEWHPLVSGNPDTVHQAGISVRNQAISEEYIHEDDWEEMITRMIE